jgi:ABC-type multidrug transport system ATPase subunit
MLTGLIPVTSGTATITGLDLVEDMHEIRKNIGYCPQHDVLIPNMTVEEHLFFFARVKGCSEELIASEVDNMIDSVGLKSKRYDVTANLSGGQKRKLSLGIAFIGNSKIVFLGRILLS